MMQIVLMDVDAQARERLYPLTLTRPVHDLRVGILTIKEKWEKALQSIAACITVPYLTTLYGKEIREETDVLLLVRTGLCPDDDLIKRVQSLYVGQGLTSKDGPIILKVDKTTFLTSYDITSFQWDDLSTDFVFFDFMPSCWIKYPEHLFIHNGSQIKSDFERLTRNRISAKLDDSNVVIGDQIFVEEGVHASHSIFNTEKGPIYLAKGSEVWEGSLIRGPFALCEGSQVKMGTKIYGNVTVGPSSRVGGELNTCVIWGFTNKGHDGYLGSSVLGAWCNWGAGTDNSNMKNNQGTIRLYDYSEKDRRDSGQQVCGVIMGDFVKCAIQSAFHPGTVVGVGSHVFGLGFSPRFVPDFSWGWQSKGSSQEDVEFPAYDLDKFLKTMTDGDVEQQEILKQVYQMTK